MNVTVVLEARYLMAPDGSVWSQTGMARSFWERYLETFDTVRIVARATRVGQAPEGWLPVSGKNILFLGVPDFSGPWQCFKRYPAVRAAIRSAMPARGAVIMRVGSLVANIMERQLHQINYPYALEVVGDPHEVFAPGVVEHPLRPVFRWYFSRRLRQQCTRAIGVAYVTSRSLQARYPTSLVSTSVSDVDLNDHALLNGRVSTNYSSLELRSENVAKEMRRSKQGGPTRLVTVGSLAQLYKGTDILIEAVARCVRAGVNLTAVIVGDGKHRPGLMAQAERLGIASRIRFAGQITAGEAVQSILDASDLFVLPSRTEGLPRALVEAMARGLPCIGSDVGGIPELLDASELVPVGDPTALAIKIQEVVWNPLRMEEMSRRNLACARLYLDSVVGKRRRAFYEHVRECTQRWEMQQTA